MYKRQLLVQSKSPLDLRGKNRSGNAKPGTVCLKIHEHISSFEVKVTHYGGKPKKYLDAHLNVKKMHDMFISKYPELEGDVNYTYYYGYFKENFNYSFGRPQVDVCCECESLSNKLKDPLLSENARVFIREGQKKFYTSLKAASENKDEETAAICFDYMQNLPLPHIPVQEVFYMRQLWVNNFCIHNLKTNKAKMYVYHEGVANKLSLIHI